MFLRYEMVRGPGHLEAELKGKLTGDAPASVSTSAMGDADRRKAGENAWLSRSRGPLSRRPNRRGPFPLDDQNFALTVMKAERGAPGMMLLSALAAA